MTHLSQTLKVLMKERDWKAIDIHLKNPSLLNSFLSRIIRSEQRYISPDNLKKLAGCFATFNGKPTHRDAAKVLAAYCADQLVGPGSKLVRISVVNRRA